MGEEVKEKKPNKYVEGFKGFCTFLYNPDDHTVFGRGGASWGKILIFYFFFYACLAGFFAVCLTVMLQTLKKGQPTVVGRTNKPMVAVPETRLYNMNFKDPTEWEEYKNGFLAFQTKYTEDQNEKEGFFHWNEANLGDCYNYAWANHNQQQGCFFVGLNRIYDWAPPDETKLSFNCSWVIGKTGSGNLNPPLDFEMVNKEKSAEALAKYYPWQSLERQGLQPVQAVKVTMNRSRYDALKKGDSLDTYLECNAFIINKDGSKGIRKLPKSRPANFEIKYSKKFAESD